MKKKLKLGLLGDGIGKTQSKKLHELIGDLYGLDVSYELRDLSLKKANIKDELLKCKDEGFAGVNVTHPYKIEAHKCVKTMKDFPKGLISVNTVLFKDELLADNTDYLGFCRAYKEYFGGTSPKKVLMLGAGGVGLAIAYGLKELNAQELVVHDVNEKLLNSLVENLKKNGFNIKKMETSLTGAMKSADALINATPIGMFQYPGCAYESEGFANQTWAFDAVYTPVNTEFLTKAKEHGIVTISGFKLFLYQGIEAFKRFSGLDIDGKYIEKEFLKKYPQQLI